MTTEETLLEANEYSPAVTIDNNLGEYEVWIGGAIVGYGTTADSAKANAADFLREVISLLDPTALQRERALLEEIEGLRDWKQHPDAKRALAAVQQIERHCPCGARPETPNTHHHVAGCPVEAALAYLTPASSVPSSDQETA